MNVCLQDETLLFSSLNVIENADCTFNTTFQDHQYKVGIDCKCRSNAIFNSVGVLVA